MRRDALGSERALATREPVQHCGIALTPNARASSRSREAFEDTALISQSADPILNNVCLSGIGETVRKWINLISTWSWHSD
jgi:hypothetical protein